MPDNYLQFCGYVNDPKARDAFAAEQPYPVYGDANSAQKESGKGKDVFLWELERSLSGTVREPHNQTAPDCVSQGITGAGEDLLWVQTSMGVSAKPVMLASEPVYAGARHEIGGDSLGRGGGAIVAYGIKFAQQYGLLPRGKYGDIDLTKYDGDRANAWGRPRVGVPDALEPLAKKYPLKTASLIEGPDFYSQAIDVIANGGLIVTGSNQLYSDNRDSQGFCNPQGRGGHCTYYRGFTDNPKRPGIVYQQSWGNMIPRGNQQVTLPHGVLCNLPLGAFFIEADNFNRMHRGNEVWAMTFLDGWEPAPDDWIVKFW